MLSCFPTILFRHTSVFVVFLIVGECLWRFCAPAASFSSHFGCLSILSLSLWCALVPFWQYEVPHPPKPLVIHFSSFHYRHDGVCTVTPETTFHYVSPLPRAKLKETTLLPMLEMGTCNPPLFLFLSLVSGAKLQFINDPAVLLWMSSDGTKDPCSKSRKKYAYWKK